MAPSAGGVDSMASAGADGGSAAATTNTILSNTPTSSSSFGEDGALPPAPSHWDAGHARWLQTSETTTTTPKMCKPGGAGGMWLPAFGEDEQNWDTGVRQFLYLMGLLWCFAGVAIIADVFMAAIEKITSKKKLIVNRKTGRPLTVKVWNETVANLTLMVGF